MTMLTTPDLTYLNQAMQAYIRTRPIPSSTKKESEKSEAHARGYKNGISAGLAFYGNQLRIDRWRGLNPDLTKQHWIPSLLEHDFLSWLREVDKRWNGGEWTDKSDDEFLEQMDSEYMQIVFDEEWQKFYESERKDAVRSGRLEPTQEDAIWIQEELNTYLGVAQPLENLLKKIDNPK